MADHYEVGDQLEHQTYGPCTVVGTETKTIGGQEIAFVTLKREHSGQKVFVPAAKLSSVAVRKPEADVVRLEATLVLPSDTGAKSWHATLVGLRLVQSTTSGGNKARETQRTFSSQHEATHAFDAAFDKKLAEGFVQLRDAKSARAGDVVFHMATSDDGHDVVYDLSPDGKTLALGVNEKDGASIHFIDLATGERRLVHKAHSTRRSTVDTILFDATGQSLIYSNRSETRHLDLETRTATVIASINDTDTSVSYEDPSWDLQRTRLLVFEAHDRARVLDASFQTLLEVTAPPDSGSYSGVLSPSGEKLALQVRTPDGPSNVVEIWSIASRSVITRVHLKPEGVAVAFDWTETKLLVATFHELSEVAIATGDELWCNPEYPGRPAPSRDGRRFLLHRYLGLSMFDEVSQTVTPLELELTWCRLDGRLVWSHDGSLAAVGSNGKHLIVYKL